MRKLFVEQCSPFAAHFEHHAGVNSRSVHGSKRHDSPRDFGTVGEVKGKFLLVAKGNSNLVVTGFGIDANPKQSTGPSTKVVEGIVATRDGKSERFSDRVEATIGDTETPDEIVDVGNMFLMGFWSENDDGTPTALSTRADPIVGEEGFDLLGDDVGFVNTVSLLAAGDRGAGSSINVKFPADNRSIDTGSNESIPVPLDDRDKLMAKSGGQVIGNGDGLVELGLM